MGMYIVFSPDKAHSSTSGFLLLSLKRHASVKDEQVDQKVRLYTHDLSGLLRPIKGPTQVVMSTITIHALQNASSDSGKSQENPIKPSLLRFDTHRAHVSISKVFFSTSTEADKCRKRTGRSKREIIYPQLILVLETRRATC